MLLYNVKKEEMRIGKHKGKTMYYASPIAQDKITTKQLEDRIVKTPRIQFFPKLEMRNQAKNVQHVVIRESEAGSAKPSPNPGDLPEAPDSAL